VFLRASTDDGTPVPLCGLDDVVAEEFKESARHRELGAGDGVGPEDVGAAQCGGG
jgi:hypothetical protein